MKTLNWEKSQRGEGEFTIICRLQELQELFAKVSVLGLIERREDPIVSSFSLEKKEYLCLTDLYAWEQWYGRDYHNHMICIS